MVLEEPQEMVECSIYPCFTDEVFEMYGLDHSFIQVFTEHLLCARHYSRQREYSMSKRDESSCPSRSLHSS